MSADRGSVYRALLLILALAWTPSVHAGGASVSVRLERAASPWGVSQLDSLLVRELNREPNTSALISRDWSTPPVWPGEVADSSHLPDYQITISLTDQRLERRKSFSVPLLFQKYEVFGVMSGELRVVNQRTGKQLLAESLLFEKHGPRIFQGSAEDDKHDPDLHQTPLEQLHFFQACEYELTKIIVDRVRPMLRKRQG